MNNVTAVGLDLAESLQLSLKVAENPAVLTLWRSGSREPCSSGASVQFLAHRFSVASMATVCSDLLRSHN